MSHNDKNEKKDVLITRANELPWKLSKPWDLVKNDFCLGDLEIVALKRK